MSHPQPVDLKAALKPSKTVKREIEASKLESVDLKEVPQDEQSATAAQRKKSREEPPVTSEPLEPLEPFPEVPKEKAVKKKKKKAKPKEAPTTTTISTVEQELVAEEKELLSPEPEESPLPMEVRAHTTFYRLYKGTR